MYENSLKASSSIDGFKLVKSFFRLWKDLSWLLQHRVICADGCVPVKNLFYTRFCSGWGLRGKVLSLGWCVGWGVGGTRIEAPLVHACDCDDFFSLFFAFTIIFFVSFNATTITPLGFIECDLPLHLVPSSYPHCHLALRLLYCGL